MIRIPGYRLLEELASGSSGTVYRGVQEALGREVAVKVLRPGLFDLEETRARFLREAKIQAGLNHPNLLGLFDAGFADGRPYLAMEWVPGGTLRDRLTHAGELPADELLALGVALASALAHAHAAGIVHRDLKPENILITEDGRSKIADFGLARTESPAGGAQTASGVILGTPGYMAPEVLSGEPARTPADVYALGVMFYEAAAGRRPFVADDLSSLLTAQLKEQPQPLESLRGDLPAGLPLLISRCLVPEPADRPCSAELAVAFEELLAQGAGAASWRPGPTRAMALSRPQVAAGVPTSDKHATQRAETRTRSASRAPAERRAPSREMPALAPRPVTTGSAIRKPDWRPILAIAGVAVVFAVVAASREVRPPQLPPPLEAVPAPGPVVPVIRWVTGSVDRIRLGLETPAPEGLALSLSRSSGRGTVTTVALALKAGDSEHQSPPLAGGLSWVGRLSLAGAAPRTFAVELLERYGKSGAVRLGGQRDLTGITMKSRGDHVVIAWRRRHLQRQHEILFRESRDGGDSWSPPVVLSDAEDHPSCPEIALSGSGLAVAWETRDRPKDLTVVRCRKLEEFTFQPRIELEGGGHDPGLTGAAGGGFYVASVVSGSSATEGKLRLWLVSLEGKRERVSGTDLEFPHVHASHQCCTLIRQNKMLMVFACRERSEKQTMLVWTRRSLDPSGPWETLRPLTTDRENVEGEIDAASDDQAAVVGYLTDTERLIYSFNGGNNMDSADGALLGSMARTGKSLEPAVAIDGGRIFAALLTFEPTMRCAFDFNRLVPARRRMYPKPTALEASVESFEPKRFRLTVLRDRLAVLLLDAGDGLLYFTRAIEP